MIYSDINLKKLDKRLMGNINIIYGAGYNGAHLFNLLEKTGINISGFYDDDESRWGGKHCGKLILTKEELTTFDKKSTNIILSSMYIPQMGKKAEVLGFQHIYMAMEVLMKKDSDTFKFFEYQKDGDYIRRLRKVCDCFEDELSKQYFAIIQEAVESGEALEKIREIYCGEKQYLLGSICERLDGCNILDAGAYTGDTLKEIIDEGIVPEKIYCFEADKNNYERLKKTCDMLKCNEKVHIENNALWNKETTVEMKNENYNARISIESKGAEVHTTSIDNYFKDIKLGFIKMDIEGAERKALEGGIKTLKRDRPILAISIYHSLEDVVGIPELLIREMENYTFFVRLHSYTYSEAILYGIPKELN